VQLNAIYVGVIIFFELCFTRSYYRRRHTPATLASVLVLSIPEGFYWLLIRVDDFLSQTLTFQPSSFGADDCIDSFAFPEPLYAASPSGIHSSICSPPLSQGPSFRLSKPIQQYLLLPTTKKAEACAALALAAASKWRPS
jgi:hypothetical protein